jgi:hypothetical protein
VGNWVSQVADSSHVPTKEARNYVNVDDMSTPVVISFYRTEWRDSAGRLHRVEGPAVIDKDSHEWWWHGVQQER